MTMKRIGAVLAIALLLVVSYYIPNAVTFVQDRELEKEAKSYEIENIVIAQNTNHFLEELDNFPDILAEPTMYVKSGKNHTAEQINEVGKIFASQLANVLYDGEISTQDIENGVKFENRAYIGTSPDYETVYYLWSSYFVDSKGNEYTLWLDDATGKVLGFVCPVPAYFWKDQAILNGVVQVLAEYYGFSTGEFYYPNPDGNGAVILYNEEEDDAVILPLIFGAGNMMVNISDNEYTMAFYDTMISSDLDAKDMEEFKEKMGLK